MLKDIHKLDQLFLSLIEFSKRNMHEESIKNEISEEQFKVLFHLYNKEKAFMNEIGESQCISSSTSTVVVDKLIKREFVYRKRSENDRRQVEVYITEKGKECLDQILSRRRERFEGFLANLNEQEIDAVDKGLTILNEKIKEWVREEIVVLG